jgi:hypothetical protein
MFEFNEPAGFYMRLKGGVCTDNEMTEECGNAGRTMYLVTE